MLTCLFKYNNKLTNNILQECLKWINNENVEIMIFLIILYANQIIYTLYIYYD